MSDADHGDLAFVAVPNGGYGADCSEAAYELDAATLALERTVLFLTSKPTRHDHVS